MTSLTYTGSLSWGGDTPTAELEDVVVSYAVQWGRPARQPSYSHGGLPAEPNEIVDVEIISIDGTPWAKWDHGYGGQREREYVRDQITETFVDAYYDEMIEAAAEHDIAAERAEEEREYQADYAVDR